MKMLACLPGDRVFSRSKAFAVVAAVVLLAKVSRAVGAVLYSQQLAFAADYSPN